MWNKFLGYLFFSFWVSNVVKKMTCMPPKNLVPQSHFTTYTVNYHYLLEYK